MNQKEKISNNFSDAYLLASLEGKPPEEILQHFSKEFPELAQEFIANAHSLDLMYGDIGAERYSENEIGAAYKKVSEKLDSATTRHSIVSPIRQGGFAS